MNDKITIDITGESRVYFSKIVEMEKADYEKYLSIIDSDLSFRYIDSAVAELADKYGFGYGDDISHYDDPEEVAFTPIPSSSND